MGPEDYRCRAADCLYLAQRLADEQSRRELLEMARAWIELAVQAERNAKTESYTKLRHSSRYA
jgi:hypothetical protein